MCARHAVREASDVSQPRVGIRVLQSDSLCIPYLPYTGEERAISMLSCVHTFTPPAHRCAGLTTGRATPPGDKRLDAESGQDRTVLGEFRVRCLAKTPGRSPGLGPEPGPEAKGPASCRAQARDTRVLPASWVPFRPMLSIPGRASRCPQVQPCRPIALPRGHLIRDRLCSGARGD